MWYLLLLPVLLAMDVPCPGGKYACPSTMTCCELPSGAEGCCPFEKAVCCEDKVHCCPSDWTCDVGAGRCKHHSGYFVKMVSKVDAKPMTYNNASLGNHLCPDRSQCPDEFTCCSVSSERYGCCPLPNAVCCEDDQHCCPSGSTCSSGGLCTKREDETSEVKSEDVICPGGHSMCPSRNTCCPVGSGRFSCCPLPSATCCSDLQHCCPFGYHCLSPSGCIRADNPFNVIDGYAMEED